MGALVIEARSTSYYNGSFVSESDEFAAFETWEAAALFALDCNADGAFDFTNDEPDFVDDPKRSTRSYFVVDADSFREQEKFERRERMESLAPFGTAWREEQVR